MDIVAAGPKARLTDCRGFGGRAGIALVGDHQVLTRCDFRNSGYNVMFDDFAPVIGNQSFSNSDFAGATIASIGIAATNQIDSALLTEIHTGFAPLSFYKEPATPNVSLGLNGTLTNSTLIEIAVESIGLGFISGTGTNNVCINNRWIGGGCGATTFNATYAPATGSTLAVAVGTTTPVAMVTCASFSGLLSFGFDFNPTAQNVPAIKATGNIYQCDFIGCPGVVQNVSPSVCAFQWGLTLAGMRFDFSLGRGSWLYANNALTAGMPARESENGQALTFAIGYPFAGVVGATVSIGQSVAIWREAAAFSVAKADSTQAISGGPCIFPTVNGFAASSMDGTASPGYAVGGSPSGNASVNMTFSPSAASANVKTATGLNAASSNVIAGQVNQFSTAGSVAQTLPAYAAPGTPCRIINNTGSIINISAISTGSMLVNGISGTTDTVAAGVTATYISGNTLKSWLRV
jgi:hypothetical protein